MTPDAAVRADGDASRVVRLFRTDLAEPFAELKLDRVGG